MMETCQDELNGYRQDDFQEVSSNFLSWLTQHATLVSPKIELVDLRDQSAGRGVLAKQDIQENEELFSIPRSTILTPTNSSIPNDIIDELDNPWHKLILAMLFEYRLGASSKWRPYLAILPEHFDTLMFWSKEELGALQGSAVIDKIGKASAENDFRSIILPLIRQNSEVFAASTLTNDDLLQLCHRMGSTIMAYAFDVEQPRTNEQDESDGWEVASDDEAAALPVGMIPMADMLNADATRNNAKLFYEEDRVSMRSIQPIRQGQEIFNDYGPLPRADLLRRYGYVTSNYAQYDLVEIDQALILEELTNAYPEIVSKGMDRRLEFLDACDMSVENIDISHENEHGTSIPEELTASLKVLTLNDADFGALRSTGKLPATTIGQLDMRQLNVLSNILLRRRCQYGPHPLAQNLSDLAALESESTTQTSPTARRKAMALQVIIGEKQILQAAFDRVQSLLQSTGQKRKMVNFEEAASVKKHKV